MSEALPKPVPALAQGRAEAARKASVSESAELHRSAPTPATADTALDTITVTGTRLKADTSRVLPNWREDESLPPDEWLERIRERVRRGERNDAALSLRRLTHKHPLQTVPEELLPLLAGRP